MLETVITQKSERGAVQNAILALLAQRPRHGYELRDLFEAAVGGHWELNSGQIYSSLDRLSRDGLVVEEGIERGGGPDKRFWALTELGARELEGWFNSPIPRDYRLRDEFYLKLMIVLVTQPARAGNVLIVQRRELHDLTARRNSYNPKQQLAHILLLDSAVMHTEAELRWLDMVEARLDDIRGQPPPIPPPRQRGRPRKLRTED